MRQKSLFFVFSFLSVFVLLLLSSATVTAEFSRPSPSSISSPRATPSAQVRRPQTKIETSAGYCCENGTVTRSSSLNCSRARGQFAPTSQAAEQLCNAQKGFCCQQGEVRASARGKCRTQQGDFFLRRTDAERKCAITKGFCLNRGKIAPGTKGDCEKRKGTFFQNRQAAISMLATTKGFCCKDGKVVQTTQRACSMQRGFFSIDTREAHHTCGKQNGYCVVRDSVSQMNQSMCQKKKGMFFIDKHAAERSYGKTPGFCCELGTVSRSLRAACSKKSGKFSTSRTQLVKECNQAVKNVAPAKVVTTSSALGKSQSAVPEKSGKSVPPVEKTTRDSSAPAISYMQFSPMRMSMVSREDSFENVLGDSSDILKFNTLEATITCGSGKQLHTASIITGNDYFTYDAIEKKVTEGGKVQLFHITVATFGQFSRDFPTGTTKQTARIPIVLKKQCISDVGITSHRYERILEVDYSPWKSDGKLLAAGSGQIQKKTIPSSGGLASRNLTLQQPQTAIEVASEQGVETALANLDTSHLQNGFTLNQPAGNTQERTYWYVGNIGTMEDEFVHAPSGANPTPSQGIRADLQGNFSCGIGEFVVTPVIYNETNDVKILTPVDEKGNFTISSIELLKKDNVVSYWNCYPGNSYFNKSREIKLKGQYKCAYPDGSIRQFESERIAIPFQFSCDRRPLGNRPVSKVKLYKHECPDGYRVEGTNQKFIINEKGWDELVICEK